ncbi:hypothetical protein ACWENS_44805 [Streptomyces sp. NPDC004532]
MTNSVLALGIFTGRILKVDPLSGDVEILTARTGARPDGIVVVGDSVYWTTMGVPITRPELGTGEAAEDYSRHNGGLHALALDAPVDGTPREIVATGAITTGKQLTSDGTWLYWGDREGCRVTRVRLDGSDLTDLIVNDGSRGILDQCVGVAVDPTAGYLYWSQKGPAKGGQGRILRAPLTLAPGESHARRSGIEVLWDGLPEPIDLELCDGYLYWTDRGAAPAGNTLNRAPIPAPGCPSAPPEILADGFREAIGLAIDQPTGWIHVSDLAGTLRHVPLPGGPAAGKEPRTHSLGEPLTGLAVLSNALLDLKAVK